MCQTYWRQCWHEHVWLNGTDQCVYWACDSWQEGAGRVVVYRSTKPEAINLLGQMDHNKHPANGLKKGILFNIQLSQLISTQESKFWVPEDKIDPQTSSSWRWLQWRSGKTSPWRKHNVAILVSSRVKSSWRKPEHHHHLLNRSETSVTDE